MPPSFFTVDIGNSRIKIGRFDILESDPADPIPEPLGTLNLEPAPFCQGAELPAALNEWLTAGTLPSPNVPEHPLASHWFIASVNRPLTRRFTSLLQPSVPAHLIHELVHADLPLTVRVEIPERVGIDRLLFAVAANRIRRAGRPAVLIDLGTAITVDLVAADGAFEGGAILPGIGMAAQAMAEQTDALPLSPLVELDQPPEAVGKSTLAAIESGLFWGAMGGIRALVAQYALQLDETPDLFLTGGAAPQIADLLSQDSQPVYYLPNLVLSGIAIAARSRFAPADQTP